MSEQGQGSVIAPVTKSHKWSHPGIFGLEFNGAREIAPVPSDSSEIGSDDHVIEHFECNVDEDIYYLKAVMMWYQNGEFGEYMDELKELDARIYEVEKWLMFTNDVLGGRVRNILQSH
ncbi:hypothetical protein K435DRAFT_802076 [Dendrothele bispora CBS 962.96]|uniref:Uncharacterized protein n=1 Tax=Dendrothele bispora (strain CBS 962.96) TaxID=1314807 RepID=A0A4S8LMA4_DENBC|nr:hypothetical protein K435DRAFT_802076 [Dendrothele bispora CBS 962.96]